MLTRLRKFLCRDSSLRLTLDEHLRSTPDFIVRHGKKYYPAADIREILNEHRRK